MKKLTIEIDIIEAVGEVDRRKMNNILAIHQKEIHYFVQGKPPFKPNQDYEHKYTNFGVTYTLSILFTNR